MFYTKVGCSQVELREKWLDYYEANHRWIKIAGLEKGQRWNKSVDGVITTLQCPSSILIIGVVSSLDTAVFMQIGTFYL